MFAWIRALSGREKKTLIAVYVTVIIAVSLLPETCGKQLAVDD